jgi:hypothetical protein
MYSLFAGESRIAGVVFLQQQPFDQRDERPREAGVVGDAKRLEPCVAQQSLRRAAREEAEVRAIEHAAVGVVQHAGEKLKAHRPERDVGQRDDHRAAGTEEAEVVAQHGERIDEMFEHVGEEDDVERLPCQRGVDGRKVGEIVRNHAVDAARSHFHRGGIVLDAGDFVAGLADVLRGGRVAAADVENAQPAPLSPHAQQR